MAGVLSVTAALAFLVSLSPASAAPAGMAPAVLQRAIAAGDGQLAVAEDGSLWGWGYGSGIDFDTITVPLAPIHVDTDTDWLSVSSGIVGLAIKNDHSLWIVTAQEGPVEDGLPTVDLAATQFGSEKHWLAAAAGPLCSLLLKDDGTLWSLEPDLSQEDAPDLASMLKMKRAGQDADWTAVAAGGIGTSLAFKGDGSLWTVNYTMDLDFVGFMLTLTSTVARVGTDNDWAAIAAGGTHSLAIKKDGSLWAWGRNGDGELGDGTTETRYLPVKVLTGVKVSAGVGGDQPATTFTDVSGSPYETAICDLAGRGVIAGFEDGTFRPDDPVSRQQFAKMMVKALGLPVTGTEICPFSDVLSKTAGDDPLYPAEYVAVCSVHGITQGKTATTFDPYNSITHQQLITMIVRSSAFPDPPTDFVPGFISQQFSLEEHYRNARKAAYAGVLEGLQGLGASYDFAAPTTRGECAQLLHNLLEMLEG